MARLTDSCWIVSPIALAGESIGLGGPLVWVDLPQHYGCYWKQDTRLSGLLIWPSTDVLMFLESWKIEKKHAKALVQVRQIWTNQTISYWGLPERNTVTCCSEEKSNWRKAQQRWMCTEFVCETLALQPTSWSMAKLEGWVKKQSSGWKQLPQLYEGAWEESNSTSPQSDKGGCNTWVTCL